MPTRHLLVFLVAVFSALVPGIAAACSVSAGVTANLGKFSPAAVQLGAVPALQGRGGMSCATSVLTLLRGNYMRARFQSANGLQLVQAA